MAHICRLATLNYWRLASLNAAMLLFFAILSIAYHKEAEEGLNETLSTITIENCVFFNNSAFLVEAGSSSDTSRVDQVVNTNLFTGRGGGMAIIPQDAHFNVRAAITNNIFQQNVAEAFGGGMVMLFDSTETSHRILIENCTFLSNRAVLNFGGGIQVAFLLSNLFSDPTRITLVGSRFEDNSAYFGGGFGVLQVRRLL